MKYSFIRVFGGSLSLKGGTEWAQEGLYPHLRIKQIVLIHERMKGLDELFSGGSDSYLFFGCLLKRQTAWRRT